MKKSCVNCSRYGGVRMTSIHILHHCYYAKELDNEGMGFANPEQKARHCKYYIQK